MKERETDGRFKIGDIIADKDAGTLMIVDRRESEDSTWGKYEYEVHWSREGDTSWVSEMLLMGIKAAGMKKYLSLMLDALKKSSVGIGARAQAREEWLVEQAIEREENVKKEK
jgi:hypothetical protein